MLDYVTSDFRVIHVWRLGKFFAESGRSLIQIIFRRIIGDGLRITVKILRVNHFPAQDLKPGSPNTKARTANHHTAKPRRLLRKERIINDPIYF
jgi:hypothetical protein